MTSSIPPRQPATDPRRPIEFSRLFSLRFLSIRLALPAEPVKDQTWLGKFNSPNSFLCKASVDLEQAETKSPKISRMNACRAIDMAQSAGLGLGLCFKAPPRGTRGTEAVIRPAIDPNTAAGGNQAFLFVGQSSRTVAHRGHVVREWDFRRTIGGNIADLRRVGKSGSALPTRLEPPTVCPITLSWRPCIPTRENSITISVTLKTRTCRNEP
jgi:hypothetical protein